MNIKSLILGSAAAIVAGGAVQAADLPVAEPVDYVRVCDAYGAGYFFIPGTDTCLKINGQVEFVASSTGYDANGNVARQEALYDFDTNINVTFTAREETELGTLTAIIELDDTAQTGSVKNGAAIDRAYLQLGGFYAGVTDSLVDFNGGKAFDDYGVGHDDLNAIGYHMDLGNGVTASIALEEFDRNVGATNIYTFTPAGVRTVTATGGAGRSMPSVAASLAVSQGWGSLAVGAAAFQVRYTNAAVSTDLGYTVGADAAFNIAEGVEFTVGAGYSLGTSGDDRLAGHNSAGTLNSHWKASAGLSYAFADNFSAEVGAGYFSYNDRTATNADVKLWGVSAGATYTPVTNLSITGKVGYEKVDFRAATPADYSDYKAELAIKRTF